MCNRLSRYTIVAAKGVVGDKTVSDRKRGAAVVRIAGIGFVSTIDNFIIDLIAIGIRSSVGAGMRESYDFAVGRNVKYITWRSPLLVKHLLGFSDPFLQSGRIICASGTAAYGHEAD